MAVTGLAIGRRYFTAFRGAHIMIMIMWEYTLSVLFEICIRVGFEAQVFPIANVTMDGLHAHDVAKTRSREAAEVWIASPSSAKFKIRIQTPVVLIVRQ